MNAYIFDGSELLRSTTDESIWPKDLSSLLSTRTGSKTTASEEKGLANSPAPYAPSSRSGFPQAAFAFAAIAGVTTFTLICFGFVSSRFGMCSVSAPF
jgi:hypothetical protein